MASTQLLTMKILAFGVLLCALSSSSITVCSAHPSDGSSREKPPYMIRMMGALSDWLNRLHSLLVEEPSKPSKPVTSTPAVDLPTEPAISTPSTQPPTQPLTVSSSSDDVATTPSSGDVTTTSGSANAITTPNNVTASLPGQVLNRVQFVRDGSAFDYSLRVVIIGEEFVWRNLTQSAVNVNTSAGGVLVTSFGAHISHNRFDSLYQGVRFLINNRAAFDEPLEGWGEYYLNHDDEGEHARRPLSFAQMHELGNGVQWCEVMLQTRTTAMAIDGGGMMVAAFPPPAFLNSIRAESQTGLSNDNPYQNIVHEVEVKSGRALLVLAANGRIDIDIGIGRREQTTLIYTVNGIYDNSTDGRYHATRVDGTKERFNYRSVHFGFYQLRMVTKGSHTVRLEGSGAGFELDYVTSQVMVIPVNNVQLNSTAEVRTLTTPQSSTATLLAVNVVAVSDSVLVIAASFSSWGCSRGSSSYQFNLNGDRLFPSLYSPEHQLGAWREIHYPAGTSWKVESPGSMLAFAQVPKGTHFVELVNVIDGPCSHRSITPALQVGVVPELY